jgi:DNA mismatch repair protein MutS2
MKIGSKDLYDKIEFSKILDFIKVNCQGSLGRQHFDNIPIFTTKNEIELRLKETFEWIKAIEDGMPIPFSNYEDISDIIPLLKKEGYVLEIEEISKIYSILTLSSEITNYFQDYQKQKAFPNLSAQSLEIQLDQKLHKEIERIFDETGEIRPNASDALMKISKAIYNKEREVAKVFRSEITVYKDKGFLVENLESVRNNRFVLVVGAEHKRKIAGIIHDESATGKTVFIEPEATMSINNEIHSLYSERRAEIYRIIRDLCHFIRPYADNIFSALQIIAKLDVIRAKSLFARKIGAKIPNIQTKPTFDLKEAYNPILLIKSLEHSMKVIPFDLVLFGENRIMVLSGPNAGGKSVTMKTVALLQVMVQAGIPVTCDENSKFGIFNQIYADIGDQQSVEDDLSTYSSHLTNMKVLVEHAEDKTLFIIDEFGSGTDPKIGGAIAESILRQLVHQKAFGVITTHYSNLKFFAHKTKGIVNASMEFDKNALKPTYNLIVGKPGSSFAFEIAQKIGLPENIISHARNKAGKNEKAIEELLVQLEAERQEFESKMLKTMEKEEKLDKLIQNYDELNKDLEFKRKKLKKEQKEASLFAISEAAKEAQKMIKELRAEKDLEKVQAILEEKKVKQTTITQEIINIKEDIYEKTQKAQKPFVVGDFVKMQDSTTIGEILNIDKNIAEIQMGILKLKTPLRELIHANEPIQTRKKSVNLSGVSTLGMTVDTKLDLRGYRLEEAQWFLEEFLDKALVNNAFELRIIHGIGNGILKKMVHKKLKEFKIKEFWHPEADYGGEGVTLVRP